MKNHRNLCFTKDGLLNPDAVTFITNQPSINTVLFILDGSLQAFHHLMNFDRDALGSNIEYWGISKTPLYELRVIGDKGALSLPHYVYTHSDRVQWLCSEIASPHLDIAVSDIQSTSNTTASLDLKQKNLVCYAAYKLWGLMLQAEHHLVFPAAVIDAMTRWTYSLTANTIDVAQLRQMSGLETLNYHSGSDMLSVEVSGDTFDVKLSVLNDFYGKIILPEFNKALGRRLRLQVSVMGDNAQWNDPQDMSYGELGQVIDSMEFYTQQKMITSDAPLAPDDLIAFARKLKIDDESCLWQKPSQPFNEFLEEHKLFLVPGYDHNQSASSSDSEDVSDHQSETV
jgi:hypothetical protein